MQFSIIAVAAMAATVLAAPQGMSSWGGVEQSQCGGGDMICCNPVDDESTKALLLAGPILKNGLLNLLGMQNSACVNPQLLNNVAILAFADQEDNITQCKYASMCCPADSDYCYDTKTGKQYQKESDQGY
ncbi:hypothetical protein CNMCM5793_006063 [Aspergillus hiratsukae]|uniref:Hydrophobin n=1 Tax=Aspergillus hiratsukae TaxID=1194566 RepID=A0A8H6UAV7_9EURO|nr:hypothetical protein CNMCM5793_006063 [Aspergillus hiratsukae]